MFLELTNSSTLFAWHYQKNITFALY